MKNFLITLMTGVFMFTFTGTAFAATVDLSPVANNLITIVAGVLTIIAGWVGNYVVSWLAKKAHVEDQQFKTLAQDRLNVILYSAIEAAEAYAKKEVADPNSSIRAVKIDNFFIGAAVKYAVDYIGTEPGGLWGIFGLTEEKVKSMIINRLNSRISNEDVQHSTSKEVQVVE